MIFPVIFLILNLLQLLVVGVKKCERKFLNSVNTSVKIV